MGKYADLLAQDLGAQAAGQQQGGYAAMLASDLRAPVPQPSAAKPAPKSYPNDNVHLGLQALGVLGGKTFANDMESIGVGDALRGYQKALLDPLHGAAQFVENAVAKGASYLPDNPVSRYLQNNANQTNAAMTARQQAYQQGITHPNAATAGEVVGNALPFVTGPGALALKSGGATANRIALQLPGVGRFIAPVADAATQGAMTAAAMPVTSGDYGDEKGKQLGVGLGVGGTVGALTGTAAGIINRFGAPVRAMINPEGAAAQTLGQLASAGDATRAQQLAQALRGQGAAPGAATGGNPLPQAVVNGGELVPGSQPTLPELLGGSNLVRIQKVLGNRPEIADEFGNNLFQQRQAANNAARWQAINNVAGTDDGLQAAIDARRANAAPRIDALLTNGQPVNVDPVLQSVGNTQASPFGVDPAISRGLTDVGRTINQRALPPPETAILDANGNAVNPPTQIMPDQLDAVRQNLRNFIADNASNGAVRSKQEAGLTPIQNAITDAIESANPGYRAHLAAYAQDSVPINTMEVGRQLVNDLGSRATDASLNPQLTLSGYRSALARALNNAPYGIDPAAQTSLDAVQADLQRQSVLNSQASAYGGGSATSPNLIANDWLGDQLAGTEPGTGAVVMSQLGKFVPGLGTGLEKWNQAATQRSARALADMLLNPTTQGADALDAFAQWQQNQNNPGFLQRLPLVPTIYNTGP